MSLRRWSGRRVSLVVAGYALLYLLASALAAWAWVPWVRSADGSFFWVFPPRRVRAWLLAWLLPPLALLSAWLVLRGWARSGRTGPVGGANSRGGV